MSVTDYKVTNDGIVHSYSLEPVLPLRESSGGLGSDISGIASGLFKKSGVNNYTSITDNSSLWDAKEPPIAIGTNLQYWRGDKVWVTLNQSVIAGLTVADSPIFSTIKLSGLTDGYIPYHVSDAIGLANGPVFTGSRMDIPGSPTVGAELRLKEGTNNGILFIGFKAPDAITVGGTYTWPEFGTDTYVLTFHTGGVMTWDSPGGTGMADPMTTAGDVIYRNISNVTTRLPVGTEGQIKTVVNVGGVLVPQWATPATGLTLGGTDSPAGQIQRRVSGNLAANEFFYLNADNELYILGSKAGDKNLNLRNSSIGTNSSSRINIGNNVAPDQLSIKINSSVFTDYANYSYFWSKANAPMLFGINDAETMRLQFGVLTINALDATEGGEINLKGSPTYPDWHMDVNAATWRVFSGTTPYLTLSTTSLTINGDLIAKGPQVDVRSFMDGLSGRPTYATWYANQTTTDVTAVINAAIAEAISTGRKSLFFPSGTYRILSVLTVIPDGFKISGEGKENSIIITYSTTADVFQLAGNYIKMGDMTITRSGTASAGAGIKVISGGWDCYFENLFLRYHYHGFQAIDSGVYHTLGNTVFFHVYCRDNISDGYNINRGRGNFVECMANANGGHGWNFWNDSVESIAGIRLTGCTSYLNGGDGILFNGTMVTSQIWDIFIEAPEISTNLGVGIHFTGYNANNHIVGGFIEGAESGFAPGIKIEQGIMNTIINGVTIWYIRGSGILVGSDYGTVISGCSITSCGCGLEAGNRNGIWLYGIQNVTITGCLIKDASGVQQYAIKRSGSDYITVVGNDLRQNLIASYYGSAGANSIYANNILNTGIEGGGGAPVGATYVVYPSYNATLTNERLLTGTANQIIITDGGAGAAVTLSLPQSIASTSSPIFSGLTLQGSPVVTNNVSYRAYDITAMPRSLAYMSDNNPGNWSLCNTAPNAIVIGDGAVLDNPIYIRVGGVLKNVQIDGSGFLKGV